MAYSDSAQMAALAQAVNSLRQTIEKNLGTSYGPRGFEGQPLLPPQRFDELPESLRDHSDKFKRITEEHSKKFKDSSDSFIEGTARLALIMQPMIQAVSEFSKWNITRPAQIMGGVQGATQRLGLERTTGAGNIMFDLLAAAAGFAIGGPLGAGIGGAIAGTGYAGGGRIIGDLLFGREGIEAGSKELLIREQQQMVQGRIPAIGNLAAIGRLESVQGAYGRGAPVMGDIRTLMGQLGMGQQEATEFMAMAVKQGGAKGFREMDVTSVTELTKKGIYGAAPDIANAMVTAVRYGFDRQTPFELSQKMGLTVDQVTPMMQQARMMSFMFGQIASTNIANFVANTEVGRANPLFGLARMSQAAEGMSGKGGEAVDIIQFQAFKAANPGSSYLDFLEAKRNGFADERWRRTVLETGIRGVGGGQIGRLIAAGVGMGRPGEIAELTSEYRRGIFGAAGAAGTPIIGGRETMLEQVGVEKIAAFNQSIDSSTKLMKDYRDSLQGVIDKLEENAKTYSSHTETVMANREAINDNITGALGILFGGVRDSEVFRP